jgi:ABC-type glycerol-3-phosphate transport system substrate-binding protein
LAAERSSRRNARRGPHRARCAAPSLRLRLREQSPNIAHHQKINRGGATMTFRAARRFTLAAAFAAFAALATPLAMAQKVVNIWHTEPNARTKAAIDQIIADFEKQNPGIKIVHEALAWGDLDKKMQAALASGALPEAAHGQTYIERSLSAKGMLRPLNDLIESIGENDIFEVVRKLDYNTKDKKYYGLAHAVGVDLIVYRKDMMREAGLDPNKAPATWREWVDMLKKLTDKSKGRYGLSLAGPGFFINEDVYMWVGSNGGRLFDDKGRPTFTEKPVIEALEFWKELADCCLAPDWLSRQYLDTFADLATGKAAMILGWGRGTDYFDQYAPDVVARGDIGVFNTKPVGPSAGGQGFVTQFDCEPWMVFKNAKHAEEAVAFLKFFYKPENYLKYIQTVPVHFFPITKSLRENAAYKATPAFQKWRFWVDAQHEVIAKHDPKPLLITQWKDLDFPFIAELANSTILVDMVTDVTRGTRSAADAARRAQQRAEQLITQLGYKTW